jgi:uncharacterized protein YdaU (DUF1376 family)
MKLTYVKFFGGDWLKDTRELTVEERGLYIDCLAYMWDRGEPLPGNDRLAAKLLGMQPLKYAKLLSGLIAKDKMMRGDDVVFNRRAVRDIQAFQDEQAKQSQRATRGWETKRKSISAEVELHEGIAGLKRRTPRVTPLVTPPSNPPQLPPLVTQGGTGVATLLVADGKANKTNGRPGQVDVTMNAYQNLESRIHIESPKPPEGASDERVSIVDGRVVLFNGLRQFWVDEWGGDEKGLDLALIEVSGRIQKSGSRPLEAQVSSQLARRVADKRDQDKRYQAAAKANASARSGARADAKRLDQSSPEAQMVAVNIWEGAIRR